MPIMLRSWVAPRGDRQRIMLPKPVSILELRFSAVRICSCQREQRVSQVFSLSAIAILDHPE
jgi:hypothetical protein